MVTSHGEGTAAFPGLPRGSKTVWGWQLGSWPWPAAADTPSQDGDWAIPRCTRRVVPRGCGQPGPCLQASSGASLPSALPEVLFSSSSRGGGPPGRLATARRGDRHLWPGRPLAAVAGPGREAGERSAGAGGPPTSDPLREQCVASSLIANSFIPRMFAGCLLCAGALVRPVGPREQDTAPCPPGHSSSEGGGRHRDEYSGCCWAPPERAGDRAVGLCVYILDKTGTTLSIRTIHTFQQ